MTMPQGSIFSSFTIDMIKNNINLEPSNLRYTDINIRDKFGKNALYYAIASKNNTNIKVLVEEGISLIVSPDKHALFHAIECDDLDSVTYFIEKRRIDVNIKDYGFKTPLMCAAFHNRVEIFEYLLTQKADPFKMDLGYKMAINFAYKANANEIRDILHKYMIQVIKNIKE